MTENIKPTEKQKALLETNGLVTKRGSEVIDFSLNMNVPKFNFIVKKTNNKKTDNLSVVGFRVITDVINYKLKWEGYGETVFVYKLHELDEETLQYWIDGGHYG